MNGRRWGWWALRAARAGMWLFLVLSLVYLGAGAALARPGGGQSYSSGGGGGHGGSGGGGGDGGCVFLLIELWFRFVFAHPLIGIPLTIAIIIAFIKYKPNAKPGEESWDSSRGTPPTRRGPAADLEAIAALDPEFSTVLFEDFAYALYARAHEARSQPAALAALAPYLSDAARRQLAARQPVGAAVSGVVVGALRVLGVTLPAASAPTPGAPPVTSGQVGVVLEFEANLTIGAGGAGGGSEHTQYVRERWRLARGATVRSRTLEQVGSFHCPNCGAPFASAGGGRCDYCGEVVTDGRFDWSVQGIDLLELENRPPALTGTVEEVGTDFPTIRHPRLAEQRARLLADDPAATDAALTARLQLLYAQLNTAWTNLDLRPARPYISDSLFNYLQYWIDAYRSQGLRNVLEGMRITRSEIAKVTRDKHFDAVTFRLWGTGRDSTVRVADGAVVAGRPKSDRAYSEYWTLIRGAGVRGAPRVDANCPNCGAPLATNMAGDCEHCGAKVTRGDFDWVLSKIEQDDSYTG